VSVTMLTRYPLWSTIGLLVLIIVSGYCLMPNE